MTGEVVTCQLACSERTSATDLQGRPPHPTNNPLTRLRLSKDPRLIALTYLLAACLTQGRDAMEYQLKISRF